MSGPRLQRGVTWVEFAVRAAIVGIVATVLSTIALYYLELGEKTEVQLTIMNMRSGLRQQIAERLFQGRTSELATLAGANPMQWLERPPENYGGELRSADAERLGGARWYFDVERRELRYRPRLRGHLNPDLQVLRWRVAPVYGAPRSLEKLGAIESLSLVEIDHYQWF